jgi:hypothetical protein
MTSPVLVDQMHAELNRLFGLYRLANLNARYYGCRAEIYEKWSRRALSVTAFLSALALSLLLGVDPKYALGRNIAACAAGISALLAGLTPFVGWTEKIRERRNLHFCYSQLFGQIEYVIIDIRRADQLTAEHIGLSRMVHEAFMRIEALDELEPDQKLIDREDAKVRKAFPNDYVWTNL